jgi:hypothetical protein
MIKPFMMQDFEKVKYPDAEDLLLDCPKKLFKVQDTGYKASGKMKLEYFFPEPYALRQNPLRLENPWTLTWPEGPSFLNSDGLPGKDFNSLRQCEVESILV